MKLTKEDLDYQRIILKSLIKFYQLERELKLKIPLICPFCGSGGDQIYNGTLKIHSENLHPAYFFKIFLCKEHEKIKKYSFSRVEWFLIFIFPVFCILSICFTVIGFYQDIKIIREVGILFFIFSFLFGFLNVISGYKKGKNKNILIKKFFYFEYFPKEKISVISVKNTVWFKAFKMLNNCKEVVKEISEQIKLLDLSQLKNKDLVMRIGYGLVINFISMFVCLLLSNFFYFLGLFVSILSVLFAIGLITDGCIYLYNGIKMENTRAYLYLSSLNRIEQD